MQQVETAKPALHRLHLLLPAAPAAPAGHAEHADFAGPSESASCAAGAAGAAGVVRGTGAAHYLFVHVLQKFIWLHPVRQIPKEGEQNLGTVFDRSAPFAS